MDMMSACARDLEKLKQEGNLLIGVLEGIIKITGKVNTSK